MPMNTLYGKPVILPGPWSSLDEIREANARRGHFWFSPQTNRFFRSRPLPTVYHGRFFIDSVVPPEGRRVYKICVAMDDGAIERVEPEDMPVLGYPSRDRALGALTRFVAFTK